jgi:type IV pilus assembly protein PilW
VQSAAGFATGQFAAISDCAKALTFQVTAVTGNSISHSAAAGALANQTSGFPINFQPGSQIIPLQQTAFFAANSASGESTLMRATLQGNSWNIQPLVPGVETMQVLYGIGANGITTQYVAASAVTDWTQVNTVRLGFLLEGQPGSGSAGNNPTLFNVLGTAFTVPSDTRLRHVYEMTINVRNS